MPKAFAELKAIGERLEQHYRDMQDVEFTVQEGKLFMLQTRSGKRTAEAALKAAVDMVGEGLIDQDIGRQPGRSRGAGPAAASHPRSRRAQDRDRRPAWAPRRAPPPAKSSSPPTKPKSSPPITAT